MSNHDHSKVEVDEVGNITAAMDNKGNALKFTNGAAVALDWCAAYSRYIDRRVACPNEDPRASARWANDWPASATSMPGCLYISGKDGQRHRAGSDGAKAALAGYMPPTVLTGSIAPTSDDDAIVLDTPDFIQTGKTTHSVARQVESAQDEYPPVIDRPTFVLALIITALAGMLVGLIAGAMVMA